jgi:YfiR/HmsC-like
VAALKFITCAATLLCLSVATSASAQERLRLVESDVKAGLIYSFLRYTDWPANPSGPLVVCAWAREELEGRLSPIARRTVNQHEIEFRVVRDPTQLNSCSLLYIGASEGTSWPDLERGLQGRSVLTVSDAVGFAQNGGMVEFFTANSQIGIRVNRSAIRASGLLVQDRLLRLAETSGGSAQ